MHALAREVIFRHDSPPSSAPNSLLSSSTLTLLSAITITNYQLVIILSPLLSPTAPLRLLLCPSETILQSETVNVDITLPPPPLADSSGASSGEGHRASFSPTLPLLPPRIVVDMSRTMVQATVKDLIGGMPVIQAIQGAVTAAADIADTLTGGGGGEDAGGVGAEGVYEDAGGIEKGIGGGVGEGSEGSLLETAAHIRVLSSYLAQRSVDFRQATMEPPALPTIHAMETMYGKSSGKSSSSGGGGRQSVAGGAPPPMSMTLERSEGTSTYAGGGGGDGDGDDGDDSSVIDDDENDYFDEDDGTDEEGGGVAEDTVTLPDITIISAGLSARLSGAMKDAPEDGDVGGSSEADFVRPFFHCDFDPLIFSTKVRDEKRQWRQCEQSQFRGSVSL